MTKHSRAYAAFSRPAGENEGSVLVIACPNCGDPAVDIPLVDLELLHTGMTVDCPECHGDIVFGVFSNEQWSELHAGKLGSDK